MKKIIILSLAIVSTLNMLGEQLQFDGIYYNILSDSTLEVATQPICSSPNDCLTYADIPSSIVSGTTRYAVVGVSDSAFYGYPTLKFLHLPSTITYIGEGAFYGCPLTTVVSDAKDIPDMGEDVFANIPLSNATLYVPEDAVMDYKAAEQWKEFRAILPINSMATDKNMFPILTGLQRISYTEYTAECERNVLYNMLNNTKIRMCNDKAYLIYEDFLLREENNKILIRSVPSDKDCVLYDFTLEVGDTLTTLNVVPSPYSSLVTIFFDVYTTPVYDRTAPLGQNLVNIDTLIVTDVSSVMLLDGKEYKKWTFNNGMEYVEGIGSLSGDFFQLINRKRFNTCPHNNHLVCASQNGQLLYQMDNANMEQLGVECLCEIDEDIKTSVKSIVTPTTSVHKTLQDGRLLIYAGDKTYNVMGVEVGK